MILLFKAEVEIWDVEEEVKNDARIVIEKIVPLITIVIKFNPLSMMELIFLLLFSLQVMVGSYPRIEFSPSHFQTNGLYKI